MAIEGSLSDVGLADICQLLALGRKTGCLTLTDRSNFGYIYFDKGRVVYASVLNRPDRLGDILVKNGVIQPEEFSRAMDIQSEEGDRRLGEILVDIEALTEEALEKWISLQVEEAVYHLFAWDQGTFHFKPGELPEEEEVLLVSLNADSLLLEGARRVDEWSVIEKEIHSLELLFKVTRDPGEEDEVELTSNQRKLLPILDGSRTVREVVEESGLVEFEVGKAIYELVRAGFVAAQGKRASASGDSEEDDLQERLRLGEAFYRAGMLEDAGEEFASAQKMDPAEPSPPYRLGLIELKSGNPERALARFDQMPQEWKKKPGVIRNRALALEGMGRIQDARETLHEAQKANPADRGILLAKGISELKGGDPTAARTTFIDYRNLLGRTLPPPIYFGYAVLAAAGSGHLDDAVALGREGLKHYPNEPVILVNTGAILDHKGDHEAAEQYFIRALNASSDVPAQAHKNLGDQAFRRGDFKVAQSHFEQAVRLDPALGDDVFLKLGTIAMDVQDRDLAVLFLRRAVELNPGNQEARDRLADLSQAS
jgi:tetratricopeptide (TPR) repeat protein